MWSPHCLSLVLVDLALLVAFPSAASPRAFAAAAFSAALAAALASAVVCTRSSSSSATPEPAADTASFAASLPSRRSVRSRAACAALAASTAASFATCAHRTAHAKIKQQIIIQMLRLAVFRVLEMYEGSRLLLVESCLIPLKPLRQGDQRTMNRSERVRTDVLCIGRRVQKAQHTKTLIIAHLVPQLRRLCLHLLFPLGHQLQICGARAREQHGRQPSRLRHLLDLLRHSVTAGGEQLGWQTGRGRAGNSAGDDPVQADPVCRFEERERVLPSHSGVPVRSVAAAGLDAKPSGQSMSKTPETVTNVATTSSEAQPSRTSLALMTLSCASSVQVMKMILVPAADGREGMTVIACAGTLSHAHRQGA